MSGSRVVVAALLAVTVAVATLTVAVAVAVRAAVYTNKTKTKKRRQSRKTLAEMQDQSTFTLKTEYTPGHVCLQ
jgi:hypothetical protein